MSDEKEAGKPATAVSPSGRYVHVSVNLSEEVFEQFLQAMRKAGFKNKSEFFRVALKEKADRTLGQEPQREW